MSELDVSTIAAFDVDGTVTTRDCVIPFLRRVAGTRRMVTGLITRVHRLVPAALRRDRDAIKAIAAEVAFTGRSVGAILNEAKQFAADVHDRWLRADVVERLRAHVEAGDTVLFVSASFEVYLRPLGELLGITDVLGTRLAVDGDRYTGRLDGANCRGPEKARRLEEWLDAHRGSRAGLRVVAFGDSAGDRELLAAADEAHWVGRTA